MKLANKLLDLFIHEFKLGFKGYSKPDQLSRF